MKFNKNILAVTVLMAGVVISISAAQQQKRLKNLKVYPKNISYEALDAEMDKFNFALGVKCGYCHIRNDSTKKLDFALDGKPEKEAAREMIRMTWAINKKYFGYVKGKNMTEAVTCITCHRKNPVPLTDTMPAKRPH